MLAEELAVWIVEKYRQLNNLSRGSFYDAVPSSPGVYVISEDSHVLYVGSAVDLDRRMKHDLLGTMGQVAQPHTFGQKLMKKLGDRAVARKYLRESCNLKLLLTDSLQEARTLEQCFILLLNPEYNSI